MPRKNNSLTQAQAAKLYAWLDSHRSFAAGTTARDVAVAAVEELGFGITEHNVGSARRALGIVKPKPEPPAADQVRILAAALVTLYRQAGLAPPREVLEIAGVKLKSEEPGLPLRLAAGVAS